MLLVQQAEEVGGTARRPECLLLVEQAERVRWRCTEARAPDGGLEEDIVERRGGPGRVTSDGTVEEHRGGAAAR